MTTAANRIAAALLLLGLSACAASPQPMAEKPTQCARSLAATYEKVLRDVAPITAKRLGMGGLTGLAGYSPRLAFAEREGAVVLLLDGRAIFSRPTPEDDTSAAAVWGALSELMMARARQALPILRQTPEADMCRAILNSALGTLDRDHDYSGNGLWPRGPAACAHGQPNAEAAS